MHRCIKINSADNVAVAINHIGKGTVVIDGVSARNDIPQGHKIALEEIPEGSPIIRYGVILGYALQDIRKGDWVNENMLELPRLPMSPG